MNQEGSDQTTEVKAEPPGLEMDCSGLSYGLAEEHAPLASVMEIGAVSVKEESDANAEDVHGRPQPAVVLLEKVPLFKLEPGQQAISPG